MLDPEKSCLLVATSNKGKKQEIQDILQGINIKVISLNDSLPENTESGETFSENAILKMRAAAGCRIGETSIKYVLADDSGLCVDALGSRPGIYSARYYGNGEGIEKLLAEMDGMSDREAKFVCSLVLGDCAGNIIWQGEHYWSGQLTYQAEGSHGFGYDPIFRPDGYSMTAAEMPKELKNQISHRAQAMQQLLYFLRDIDG